MRCCRYDSILHHPIEELLFLPSSSASASSRAVTGGVHSGRLAAEDPVKAEVSDSVTAI